MEDRVQKKEEQSYLETVKEFVENMQFGTVTITIHESKVVQIDKNEKYRMKK